MIPTRFGNRHAKPVGERKILFQRPSICLDGVSSVAQISNRLEPSAGIVILGDERPSRPLNYVHGDLLGGKQTGFKRNMPVV